ncbi:rhamnan synthesis F family protein [Aquicoccus sp. G2-2]|uniref:rhamnan synthesis F family protein n=1 Tax=Aquicoccus sp. G2-2 TaxID=3092120 RepID=UPI002ADFB293|nr:rhamnan synthesis F family protein [Aquicoccus sp. G2-2]MEA1114512.1 rhamnan synthesis F family protein [Aquicoccus sp. G2-2]
MIPLWKLRREWARLKQQLSALPERLFEPAARRRHDAAFKAGFPVHHGAVAQREKIALILIYQPDGVADSLILMCAHLVTKGYAPFIVSNTPLTMSDQNRLLAHAWRLLIRPNFGYDFGGYRDGIRQLARWDITPEHLLVLNDSIWFPLDPEETLISGLESSPADLTGTILRQRGEERFLESYCYMIPAKTVTKKAFQAYWNELQITSNKYKVIRRGERGFSRAMRAAGLMLAPIYPYEAFFEALGRQDDDFLKKTLLYAAHAHDEYEAARQTLLAETASPDWRDRALAHIRATIPREQPYSAYPFAMVRLFAYPILKMSNDHVAMLWRTAYLRAVEAGDLPPPIDPVRAELRCKIQADMA